MPNHVPALTPAQIQSLRCLPGMMIPASAAHGVPGADDDAIFADIVTGIGSDATAVIQALQDLDTLAAGVFADVDPERRQSAVATLREAGGARLMALTRAILQGYYRDFRVMRSLGMEDRPPFPKGYEVEQGDWSLLDPVRARSAFYRRTA